MYVKKRSFSQKVYEMWITKRKNRKKLNNRKKNRHEIHNNFINCGKLNAKTRKN